MRFQPRRSSRRLPDFAYTGEYAYHLILRTKQNQGALNSEPTFRLCAAALHTSAERYAFEVIAYCLMPDHLHLLAASREQADLIRFVQHFKQATGYRRRGLWRRSFYDHIVRKDEAIEALAAYIWWNPVRAGLVATPAEYAYSGPRATLERQVPIEDRAEALSLQCKPPSVAG